MNFEPREPTSTPEAATAPTHQARSTANIAGQSLQKRHKRFKSLCMSSKATLSLALIAALALGTALGWQLAPQPQAEPELLRAPSTVTPPAPQHDSVALATRTLEARVEELLALLSQRDAEIQELKIAKRQLELEQQQLAGEVDQLNKEWVFSYGSTREAGKFVGSLLRDAMAIREIDSDDPARAAMRRDIFLKFASLGPILQEMQNLDENPREFAVFRSAVLGEAIGMDSGGQARVQAIVEHYKTQALELEPGSEARVSLNEQATNDIRATLTPDQIQIIDSIPNSRRSMLSAPLETPSIDPRQWGRGRNR